MSNPSSHSILVVEPNSGLQQPYDVFDTSRFSLNRVSTINQALAELTTNPPDIVLLSCSFSPEQNLLFLESLKNSISDQLIPLIFIIDLSNPLSIVPGTAWGNKVGVLHSLSSKKELSATLKRILKD